MRLIARLITAVILVAAAASPGAAQTSFITFETGLVRPLALSPDGTRLFAVNAPDGTLELFDVDAGGVTHAGSVAVGMEPVAVAARTNTEVWVVNHLSDSISIVDVGPIPRVVRTLLVGDEPRDIVFAGTGGDRAFVTTAHRGQNSPYPASEQNTPGVGRADVWVFDALDPGSALGGAPETIVTLFGDKPRALAASPDGSTVYAAVFRSGNQTTTINDLLVCNTSQADLNGGVVRGPCTIGPQLVPGGLPLPHLNYQGFPRFETGLIVKLDRDGVSPGEWQDELGRDWAAAVNFDLPDLDVFAIDADADPPAETAAFAGVGTTLFNMAVNPISGALYVSNTDAQNHVRFEGPGTLAAGVKPVGEPATVRGHLAESRITVIDGGVATPRHLNKHIDYDAVPQPAGVKGKSLATPVGMAVTADGATLYVAAFGSAKIGVFDTVELEGGTFTPDAADHISLSGGGPAGLVLDGTRLYTLTRFNNSVAVVDLTLGSVGAEIQSVPLHNPEPDSVLEGRPFLYDALLTSSNGEASCASCHIFGDMDDLAWDLGNPDGDQLGNNNPFTFGGPNLPFHPMKGPMTTQSMRGMAEMGPQHWRGDRQGDAIEAFNAFNVAFPGLVGRDEGELTPADMQKFTDFALQIQYPPNPIRMLDNSLRVDEQLGRTIYFGSSTDTVGNCQACHVINGPAGHFGGDGRSSIANVPQEFKIPHLRNQYQKVGMFGMPETPGLAGPFTYMGSQVRGFGYMHDGSLDTVARFLSRVFFSTHVDEEAALQTFLMVLDTDLAPIVGQQVTRTTTSGAAVDARIDAMLTAATTSYPSKILGPGATQCDVIVNTVVAGEPRGAVRLATGEFQLDDASPPMVESAIRALADTAGQETTYTCVPYGSGVRAGVDRDEDGVFNAIDNCPVVVNPNQVDGDMNDIGDACDVGGTTTTTTMPPVVCGDDMVGGAEECDGIDLAGRTCEAFGLISGELACGGACTFDTSGCSALRDSFETRVLKISRLDKPAGEQKLTLKSDEIDDAGATFDPLAEELSVVIEAGGQVAYSGTIPAGDPDWRTTGTRFKWKARTAPNADGLSGITLGAGGQPFTIKVRAREIDAAMASDAVELTVTLTVGNDIWSGDTPPCSPSASGSSLKCR